MGSMNTFHFSLLTVRIAWALTCPFLFHVFGGLELMLTSICNHPLTLAVFRLKLEGRKEITCTN